MTELSVTAQDLARRRRLASDERLYSRGTFTQQVDIGALRAAARRHVHMTPGQIL